MLLGVMNKHQKCLVCNSNHLKPLGNYHQKHGLVKCGSCGFVFMENIPSQDELNDYYSKYSYADDTYLSPITIKVYNELLDEFEQYRKHGKILDVGCGRGWFLQEAKKRGWEVYGTEYSETGYQRCVADGINMQLGQLQADSFNSEEFDVITSFEVIEHINNPMEELGHITKFLRSGGLFYCTTPNFNSLNRYYLKEDFNIIVYPEHLAYFTRKTLSDAAKRSGLKRIKFLSTGISITRIKTSKNTADEQIIEESNSDEQLRQKIEQKWYLAVAKSGINGVLTLFNWGMTLKGYYIKP